MTMTIDNPASTATTTAPAVHVLTMSAAQMMSLASVAVAASRDDVAPVICTVRVEVDAIGRLVAIATDRYRVARVTLTAGKDERFLAEGVESFPGVTVPSALLAGFVKAFKPVAGKGSMLGAHGTVTLTLEPGAGEYDPATVKLTHAFGVSLSEREVRGNFPPVGRLLPDGPNDDKLGDVSAIALRLEWLADAAKLLLPVDAGESAAALKKNARTLRFMKTDNPAKPGPVYIHREGAGDVAEYMLQPNLQLR